MILATGWWTLLLFKKNNAEFEARKALKIEDAISLEDEYQKQKIMILGESIFLGASLIAGIWIIFNSHKKELFAMKQQNNFLMAISHELKTPVAAIDLALQTIKNRTLTQEQQSPLISNSQREIIRLRKMIDDLLLSTGQDFVAVNTNEEFKISDVVLEIIKDIPSPTEISFVSKLDRELSICSKRELFKTAVNNVVNNAIKYASEFGPIEITLSERHDKSYSLSVSDYGDGIPPKERKHIFKKFYRIGNETTREHEGTGIGLFLSDKIISGIGGQITISSNTPKGACFDIIIPTNV